MKKKIFCLFMLIMIILITGCGKKVLECKKNLITSDGISVDQQIIIEYKNNKISNEKIILSYKTNSDINLLKQNLDNQYADYYDTKGVRYYFDDNNEGFDFIIDINMRKASKKIIQKLDLYMDDKATNSYNLKKQGYTCE